MQRGPFLALAGVLTLLLVLAGGVYAYDAARPHTIARGVTVNGVDIGGLTKAQARAKLSRALVAPLERSVGVVLPSGERMTLSPGQAHLRLDVNSAVETAYRLSQRGSILTRSWRSLTGQRLDRHLTVALSYSRGAVRALVGKVADQVDRAPEDATVQPQGDQLVTSPGSDGVAVQRAALRRAIVRRLVAPGGSDRVTVPVRKLTPEISEGDLGAQYPSYIVVNRDAYELKLFRNLQLVKTYTIAVGQQGLETPAGLYDIQDKQVDPTWHVPEAAWAGDLAGKTIPPGPDNPLKARWMGFNGGAGIHGTADEASLGSAASHGCIRMSVPDVEELYNEVTVGTPVYVQ
jgi:lipoprotein-anchoring transpeptidase ErfK/SrfK